MMVLRINLQVNALAKRNITLLNEFRNYTVYYIKGENS